jgi:hypothetical protein
LKEENSKAWIAPIFFYPVCIFPICNKKLSQDKYEDGGRKYL